MRLDQRNHKGTWQVRFPRDLREADWQPARFTDEPSRGEFALWVVVGLVASYAALVLVLGIVD